MSGFGSIKTSGVKVSSLTQVINFSSLRALKVFNSGLANLHTAAASVLFFLDDNCIYLEAELLYDHIKQRQALVKLVRKQYRWRGASVE